MQPRHSWAQNNSMTSQLRVKIKALPFVTTTRSEDSSLQVPLEGQGPQFPPTPGP
jgi:hypothetical protein